MNPVSRILILTLALTPIILSSANVPAQPQNERLIPAGEFLMGTAEGGKEEQPVHKVWVDAFFLDQYEVSNAEFSAFDPSHRTGANSSCPQCPVTRVTWFDARDYCQQLGKRLPTEAEWEKAARGPKGWNFSFGPSADPSLGHFGQSFSRGALPVSSLQPNGFGLHHMSGNVWEWVADWFEESYYSRSPGKNPKGPENGFRKVVRGGNWYNKSNYVHTGMRFRLQPNVRLGSLGFRCARDAN